MIPDLLAAAACSWTQTFCRPGLNGDKSRPRPLPDRDCSGPQPVHGHRQFAAATADMDYPRLRLVRASDPCATAPCLRTIHGHGLVLSVVVGLCWRAVVVRPYRDSFADAESL